MDFEPTVPTRARSWITLLELGVDFEPVEIELGKDNKTEWFRAMNPNGAVPTIKHGETVVYESLVVNEYLCEVFGGALGYSDAQRASRTSACQDTHFTL